MAFSEAYIFQRGECDVFLKERPNPTFFKMKNMSGAFLE